MTSTPPAISDDNNKASLPLLPLRDVVVYPHMVIPLFVGRTSSIKALNLAMEKDKKIVLVAQRDAGVDNPSEHELFDMGCLANILQLLRLPDGTLKVLVEGDQRCRVQKVDVVKSLEDDSNYYFADIELIDHDMEVTHEVDFLARSVLSQFEQYVKLNKRLPPEILSSLSAINDPSRLADSIAAHMTLKIEEKQEMLEVVDVKQRLDFLLSKIIRELDVIQIEKTIKKRVQRQMEESQRAYYLNEQKKAIQKELGEMEHGGGELNELEAKIRNAGMSAEATEKALQELEKLKMMPHMSAEATVSRNYIDWMVKLPWNKQSKISKDLLVAEKILNEEHYGLEKVKERILEYLAVQKRVKKLKGPVLCLVGPPGVGKTSLGQSIARATNRKFVRMSLGGVRDEAEIRGHRRTYIGSMPGKILQKIAKSDVKNPLFILDEIDKMAMDFRGDPASALLEVLDPEQNNTFNDHYLEVDYDLSDVMFIATANSLNIPGPLLDRMEVIRLPGYTEDEKVNIAFQYLVPKQIEANGLKSKEIHFSDAAVRDIIRYYTREAGVRNLERAIAKVCRKVVRELLTQEKRKNKKLSLQITQRNLEKYLGVKQFRYGQADERDQVGQVTGLAWTEVGGELLHIEAAVVPGKGKTILTGRLGNVMQESIQAAMTVVRNRAAGFGLEKNFYENSDVHIHVPEGATPKDGPSAGIGMCTAIVSVLTNIPVRADVAMTGEITLRGEVLPIGGLKEKLLAAHRGLIRTVIIPQENKKDLKEIPKNILQDLKIVPVRWIDEVLALALIKEPAGLDKHETAPVFAEKIKSDTSNPDRPH